MSLLAQDRVEHVGALDVVEDDRLPARRDPAGKPPSHRDADAGLDLLLQPDRSPRDELLGIAVQQQHRAGVGVQDVADPRQQHVQEFVQLEMRKRRVGDDLHVLEALAGAALGLEEARVLDRDGGAVARELQQLDIERAEVARRQRADVEDADHVAGDEQRDADHRRDPLLAQNRVEHIRVIDVVEDHRLLARRHAAGKTAADRDADTSCDLLLDPDGCARDKLLRRLVEQQDRARVDGEQVAGAEQQRVEQVVKPEVRERSVGQCLQPLESFSVNSKLHPSIVTRNQAES